MFQQPLKPGLVVRKNEGHDFTVCGRVCGNPGADPAGRWCGGQRLAEALQGRGRGMDGHHHWLGVRCALWHLHSGGVWQSGRAHQSRGDAGVRHHLAATSRKSFPTGARNFSVRSRGATLVWLYFLPHWKMTEDRDAKLAVFCTAPAIRHYPGNLFCEVIGTMLLIVVVAAIGSKAAGSYRTDARPRSVLCLRAGVGDWIVAGRNHRLRHQSRARLRSARGARAVAGGREGNFRLGLRADPDTGTAAGRGAGGGDRKGRAHRIRSRQSLVNSYFR